MTKRSKSPSQTHISKKSPQSTHQDPTTPKFTPRRNIAAKPLLITLQISNPLYIEYLRARLGKLPRGESHDVLARVFSEYDTNAKEGSVISQKGKSAIGAHDEDWSKESDQDASQEDSHKSTPPSISLTVDQIKLLLPSPEDPTPAPVSLSKLLLESNLIIPTSKQPTKRKTLLTAAEYERITKEFEARDSASPFSSLGGNMTIGGDLIATILTLAVVFGFVANYYFHADTSMTYASAGIGAILGLIMDGILLVIRGERVEKQERRREMMKGKALSRVMGGVPKGHLYLGEVAGGEKKAGTVAKVTEKPSNARKAGKSAKSGKAGKSKSAKKESKKNR